MSAALEAAREQLAAAIAAVSVAMHTDDEEIELVGDWIVLAATTTLDGQHYMMSAVSDDLADEEAEELLRFGIWSLDEHPS